MARSTSRPSSNRAERSASPPGSPNLLKSPDSSDPSPVPRISRPPESRLTLAACRATPPRPPPRERGDHRAEPQGRGRLRDGGERGPRVGDRHRVGDEVVPQEHPVPSGRLGPHGQVDEYRRLPERPERRQVHAVAHNAHWFLLVVGASEDNRGGAGELNWPVAGVCHRPGSRPSSKDLST
jgi:hypothetical protein